MKNIFTNHPHRIGETYFQHMKFAFLFGFKMLIGGLVCIVHALFPFLFEKTGSSILLKVFQDFVERTPKGEERLIIFFRTIEKKLKVKNH